MLIKRAQLETIAEGRATLAFRRWRKPGVRPGTRLRTPAGVVVIEGLEPCASVAELTEEDALMAGFPNREALLASLWPDPEGRLYRLRLSFGGADPRIALREDDALGTEGIAEIRRRLERLDRASRTGPWTRRVLAAIARHPELPAVQLAAHLGLEKEWVKTQVRKLKELGLTESLQPGYRLSPRGAAYLANEAEG